jgi:sugar lactone lactonase YvrE
MTAPEVLLTERFEHPEGIVWDGGRGRLLWLDMFKGHVLSHDMRSGSVETLEVGQFVGSVAPRSDGGLVCAVGEGFGFLSEEGQFSVLTTHLADTANVQMTDGGVDPRGRFWAGSMTFEYETKPGICALYRLDADGTFSEALGGISVSNGIGWSPDSSRFYYVDSVTQRIDDFAFDVDSGTLGERRTLAEVDAGLPDGLAVDTDGCVWVAMFGGSEVHRFTPDGKVDRVVRLPGTQVTTCTFGGDDLRTLFIAVSPYGLDEEVLRDQQAGYIFALDAGVQGLPTHHFHG